MPKTRREIASEGRAEPGPELGPGPGARLGARHPGFTTLGHAVQVSRGLHGHLE